MKRNSQQYAPCASKEQIEKATRVVNESENQELKKLAGDIIILLSRVTESRMPMPESRCSETWQKATLTIS